MRLVFINEKKEITVENYDGFFQDIMGLLKVNQVKYRLLEDNLYLFGSDSGVEEFFEGNNKGNYAVVARNELGFADLTDSMIEKAKELLQ